MSTLTYSAELEKEREKEIVYPVAVGRNDGIFNIPVAVKGIKRKACFVVSRADDRILVPLSVISEIGAGDDISVSLKAEVAGNIDLLRYIFPHNKLGRKFNASACGHGNLVLFNVKTGAPVLCAVCRCFGVFVF